MEGSLAEVHYHSCFHKGCHICCHHHGRGGAGRKKRSGCEGRRSEDSGGRREEGGRGEGRGREGKCPSRKGMLDRMAGVLAWWETYDHGGGYLTSLHLTWWQKGASFRSEDSGGRREKGRGGERGGGGEGRGRKGWCPSRKGMMDRMAGGAWLVRVGATFNVETWARRRCARV
jgi:hypothetical protein